MVPETGGCWGRWSINAAKMSAAVPEGEAGTDVDVEAEAAGGAGRDAGSGAVPRAKAANLNSEDPLERIAARRLRIAARLEAKRRSVW